MSRGVAPTPVARSVPPTGADRGSSPRTGIRAAVQARVRSLWDQGLAGPLGILALTAVLVALGAVHLVWLHHYRSGLPLDIDEAGYLRFAFDNLHGWRHGGVGGLYDAVVGQRQFGPLIPLTATPILGLVGPRPVAAMSVQLVFLALLAFAVLGLGRAIAGARAGLLAAVVTILLPEVLDYTRTFHFALASAALLSAALWAIVQSEGFQRRGWSLAAGAFLGGMLLARTLTIGFVPVIAIAAGVAVVARPRKQWVRGVTNFALAVVVALGVAGWWYLPNLSVIWHYLSDVGYGAPARFYASNRHSVGSVSFWTWRLGQMVENSVSLPVALIAATTLLAALGARLRHRRRPRTASWSSGRARRALTELASPAGLVGIVGAGTYLVLATNRGGGSGFDVPLLPLAVLLVVALLWRLPSRALRNGLIGTVVLASVITAASKATVQGLLAGPRCVTIPALRCVMVVDGRGVVQQQPWATTMARAAPSVARRGPAGHWLTAAGQAAAFAVSYARAHGVEPIVSFGARDPLFNTNTVALVGRMQGDWTIPMGQLDPGRGDTVVNYRNQLTDPKLGWPNLLITVSPGPFEFRPRISEATAESAARAVGFVPVHSLTLPDRRSAHFFWLTRGPRVQP